MKRVCFCGSDVISLLATNQEGNIENIERIIKLSKPIVRIEALNSWNEVTKFKLDRLYRLRNILFLVVGVNLFLKYNLFPEFVFASVYNESFKKITLGDKQEETPHSLSKCYQIEREEYKGVLCIPFESTE